jgi:hypothetical protein
VLLFELAQLLHQLVVLGVADLGLVQDVVAVVVVGDLRAQLLDAQLGALQLLVAVAGHSGLRARV